MKNCQFLVSPLRVASHKNLTFGQSLPQLTIQLWGSGAAARRRSAAPKLPPGAPGGTGSFMPHKRPAVKRRPTGRSPAQEALLPPASTALLAVAASDAAEPPD